MMQLPQGKVRMMKIPEQLVLKLYPSTDAQLSDFAGESYGILRQAADAFLSGQERLFFLQGEAGSGRSYFLSALCAAADVKQQPALLLPLAELKNESASMLDGLEGDIWVVCDDIDAIAGDASWEEAIFHLFNRVWQQGGQMAFSAAASATLCGFLLPDLTSRLAKAPRWAISLPDDDERRLLLQRASERRGLLLEPAALEWLIRRAPRQPAAMLKLLEQADQASLMEGRRLTVPFLSQWLIPVLKPSESQKDDNKEGA